MSSPPLQQIEENLFFIVGCGRSGTTLFRIMLNAHSDVFVPPETYFFNGIAKGFGAGQSSLHEKISKLFSKWWIRDLKLEENDIVPLIQDTPQSWRNIFLAFLSALSKDSGASIFGEKTPGHFRYAQQFLEEYPHSKIIMMVRDPRASFASHRSAKIGTCQVSSFVKKWSHANEVGLSLEDNPRYMHVHFEDLISDTRNILESVCQFLNISFDEAMLEFHSRTDPDFSPEQTHHQNTQKPIFTSGLEKWKTQLSRNQISLIEYSLGEQMMAMGYKLEGHKVSFPRIRLLYSTVIDIMTDLFILKPKQILIKRKVALRQRNEHALTEQGS